jgi:TPR repeat protein
MRALFVIVLLAALILPSRHASASPPSDTSAKDLPAFGKAPSPIHISAKELQTLHTQATKGDAKAQYNLGVLYDPGYGVHQLYDPEHGVHQDYGKARQWYEKAAAQGHTGAQNDLGVMYAYGHGVPKDDVRAYMWVSLAVAHSTGDPKKYAAINLGFLTHRMTPAQIAEAQRLAQQCQAQQFKGC